MVQKAVRRKISLLALTIFLVCPAADADASSPAEVRDGVVQAEEGLFIGFLWPLRGNASSQYGMRPDPIIGDVVRHHSGLDIAAPAGTWVVASRAGRVTFAGQKGGYGQLVILSHANDMETRYGHLSSVSVKQDYFVRPGQVIGAVGSTGRSTGNHLHFEIRQSGRTADPMKWLVPYGYMMPLKQPGAK